MGVVTFLVKSVFLASVLALYWCPLELGHAVAAEHLQALGVANVDVQLIRLVLSMSSYTWVLSSASGWRYTLPLIVVLQTVCWGCYITDERVLGLASKQIDQATEKKIFEASAAVLFAVMWLIVLFGGAAELSADELNRERLVAFYTKHNPDKLASVDSILLKYKGNEDILFTRLQRKYSVLSHTAVENAVDELDRGALASALLETEPVEEVELLQPPSITESEEDEGFHLVKPSTRTTPPSRSRPTVLPPLNTVEEPTETPPPSPSSTAYTGKLSDRVKMAIAEARLAQEERVKQRIAQLVARAAVAPAAPTV